MRFVEEFKQSILAINEETFLDGSLSVFDYQYTHCEIYHQYCNYLKKNPKSVKSLVDIPFLPIEFFKNHAIKSGDWNPEKIFKSSGTTSTGRSNHYIADVDHYHRIAKVAFEEKMGPLSDYTLIALLPSYQEQGDSSLISMIDYFMNFTSPSSGYFLQNGIDDLITNKGKKLIIGVSYALLDLAEKSPSMQNIHLMETGGMKGRRKEMTRVELHSVLKKSFKIDEVWSEYGMTELQSQAYGKHGKFEFPKWAKTLIRDINDPFSYIENEKTGGINVIDLANIDSCCFIETKDLGRAHGNTFEVLGRFDNSDIRGCNLMI